MTKLFFASVLLTAGISTVAGVRAQTWETIAADYRNVRGVNFHPSYASLDGTPGYHGNASHTAFWGFYDPLTTALDVQAQLRMAKKMGINTVRVFLSFLVWEYFDTQGTPQEFDRRLDHFLTLCEAEQIRVIPVLWDFVSLRSPYSDPIFTGPNRITTGPNVQSWHDSLGFVRGIQEVQLHMPFASKPIGRYVAACSAVFGMPHRNSNCLLAWDVGNEPPVNLQPVTYIVDETLALLKQLRISDKTLVSATVNDHHPQTVAWAQNPNCDIIGIHVYGFNSLDLLEAVVWDATHVGSALLHKPVIATEIGYPGLGSSYQDVVRDAAMVPRPDLPGTNETGVGFCPWQFMIGYRDRSANPPIDDNYPLKVGNGIFYAHPDANGNAQVRDLDVVHAFVDAAIAQGIPANTLWFGTPALSNIVEMASNDPHYIEQQPVGTLECQRWFHLEALMLPDEYFSEPRTWDDFVRLANVYRNQAFGIDTRRRASQTNSNPFVVNPPSWYVIPLAESQALDGFYAASDIASPPFWSMIGQLEMDNQLHPGSLQPWTGNQDDLKILFTQFLYPMQQAIQPYAVRRL